MCCMSNNCDGCSYDKHQHSSVTSSSSSDAVPETLPAEGRVDRYFATRFDFAQLELPLKNC